MKKLKQMSGPYSIGFELSSTAHGFVATDPDGNVLYHGKQPVMGTRVFKEGQHAVEARMPRTSRRGIQRRRGREHEMERVFAPVISSIDPDFFIRRRMSYKLGKIRFESDPIGFSYSRLFHSFPTLAHLDVALMEADSAMDPRLIFEAVANHVVRRGHFLLENQNVSSTNSDIDTQVANYAEVLVSYFEDTLDERIELSLEALDINGNVTARELQKQFASAMCVSGDDIQKKTEKAQIKAIADLVAGYKADLTVLVPDAEKLPKVSISDGDALEEFLADSCPDSLVRGKKPTACQDDSAMRLDDAHVLGKEQVEVDNRIPFILGGSVRKIAKNHIYGFAGNALHHLKAIALNNPVAERL